MRVVMTSPYSLSRPGGVQGQVLGLARELRKLGVDVRVVGPCDGPPPEPGIVSVGPSVEWNSNGSVAPISPGRATARRTAEVMRSIEFKPRTPATLPNFDALKGQISQIKEQGVSRDMGEFDEDLRGVGAAIKNYRGRVIACISIAVPASRFSEPSFQDLGKAVKDTADKISYSVGYTDK